MLRIMRVRQFTWSRQVQIVQTRQPEAERGEPEEKRPHFALVVGQWPHCLIGVDQRVYPAWIKLALGIDAPVVDSDREVVGECVGGREAEVDDSGDRKSVV